MGIRATHVFRWDLDKTYLRTEFDTLRALVQTAFEKASDKRAFPGATALLRSLRQSLDHRICILSGSPTQMRQVLSAKLALDGIEYDEFVLKDNLRNALRFRFRAISGQLPYKLSALLESRSNILGASQETLFGDDSEEDAEIYSLYADILSGVISEEELLHIMEAHRAYPDQIERCLSLAQQVRGSGNIVQRILIHLEQRSPASSFARYGTRLVPIYDYLQAALIMFQDELLVSGQMLYVIREMLASGEFDILDLAKSVRDLLQRGHLREECARRLAEEIRASAGPWLALEKGKEILDIVHSFIDTQPAL